MVKKEQVNCNWEQIFPLICSKSIFGANSEFSRVRNLLQLYHCTTLLSPVETTASVWLQLSEKWSCFYTMVHIMPWWCKIPSISRVVEIVCREVLAIPCIIVLGGTTSTDRVDHEEFWNIYSCALLHLYYTPNQTHTDSWLETGDKDNSNPSKIKRPCFAQA